MTRHGKENKRPTLAFVLFIFTVLVLGPTAPSAQETSGGFAGGSVKIGYDSRACSGALEGAVRYASALACVELCDGTSWACPGNGGLFLSVTALSVGRYHACVIKTGGTAWCWGSGGSNRLGNGTTLEQEGPVAVDTATAPVTGSNWTVINAGSDYTCGIRDNGTAWCWGEGSQGQLGDGSATDQATPILVSTAGVTGSNWTEIHAGDGHTCGLRDDNTAWCWGDDASGQLGDDAALADQSTPVAVDTATAPVTGSNWTTLTVAKEHSCGIRDNGTAWCWGKAGSGRLGNNTTTPDQFTPVLVLGTPTGTNWTALAGGSSYTCGIRDDGTGYCWGNNSPSGNGKNLGDGTSNDASVPTAIDLTDVTGSNWTAIGPVIDVASLRHTCGIRDDGTGYCWGQAGSGQLGRGLNSGAGGASPYPVLTTNLPGTGWLAMEAGDETSCGLRDNNVVYCWGNGHFGLLGTKNFARPGVGVSP